MGRTKTPNFLWAPNEDDVETDAYDKLLLTEPLLEKDGFLVRPKYEGSMTLKAIW
jgi:hypothetical protein